MKRKVVVVGLGHLGSHVIQALALRGAANEIVGIDYNKKKQYGEISDLQDMMACLSNQCQIRGGDYSEVSDADVVMITVAGKVYDEDRLMELDGTLTIIDQILPEIQKNNFKGTYVVSSNPCDLVAYYIARKTGNTTIATGTALDSIRLRTRIGLALNVAPSSVEAYCLGEHGDSQVVVWSQAKVGGAPVDQMLTAEQMAEIEQDTVMAGCNIALAKGCTEFGIGQAASEIIQAILHDEHKVIPCAVDPAGYLGESGCFASIPCVVSKEGAKPLPEMTVTEDEKARFHKSCQMMRDVIQQKGM